MNSIINKFRSTLRVRAVCRYPERFMNICASNGIEFWDLVMRDPSTIDVTIYKSGYKRLLSLSAGGLFHISIIGSGGMPVYFKKVKKRYFLLAGLSLCLIAVWVSSLFIWEISVSGNEKVKTSDILSELKNVGVEIGACRLTVSQEQVSNYMLLKLPDLCWITVNTHGSKAEVLVKEERKVPEIIEEDAKTVVYAKKPGIIKRMTVLSGKALCSKDDTVAAGDVLVTGKMESMNSGTRYVNARADIIARTWYDLSAQMPLNAWKKEYTGEEKTKYSIIIAGKRQKLYLSGGISWPTYDKITETKDAVIFDGTALPLSIVKDTYKEYNLTESTFGKAAVRSILCSELLNELQDKIDNGEIIKKDFEVTESNGILTVKLHAECEENIGGVRLMNSSELSSDNYTNDAEETGN